MTTSITQFIAHRKSMRKSMMGHYIRIFPHPLIALELWCAVDKNWETIPQEFINNAIINSLLLELVEILIEGVTNT
jgi:hypothetical protein